MKMLDQIKAARRVSAPLVVVNTPDPAATINAIVDGVNGDAPKCAWDFCEGLRPRNEQTAAALSDCQIKGDTTVCNPAGMMMLAHKLPPKSVLFIHNAHRYLQDDGFVQGIWNLRDRFKSDGRTLVLLGPQIELPAELESDAVIIDEPLPDRDELAAIIRGVHEAGSLQVSDETVSKAVDATQGLSAFQVEQVTAMSLTPDGLVMDDLWDRKRQMIRQERGLEVYAGGPTFQDIGGCQAVLERILRIINGRRHVNAVFWMDELDKMVAGYGTDTSGVSDDAVGELLTEMEETKAMGLIFVGHPGTAKSMTAKATGNEAGVPTIRFDMGAMQGSLVGQSQQLIRKALRVGRAVSSGNAQWVATCNDIAKLPPALIRRFRSGIYFFDLPSAEERKSIWDLYLGKHEVEQDVAVESFDEGWTGAEIEQCVTVAYNENVPLSLARHVVVPQCVSAADHVDRLRKLADRTFLSASQPGFYRAPADNEAGGRQLNLVS